jgi:hypothetical protein
MGRVTPEILSRHGRNFLDELVAVAICVGEITMNQTRKRFIGKANDVNTKAGHTGGSMPALAKNRHSADWACRVRLKQSPVLKFGTVQNQPTQQQIDAVTQLETAVRLQNGDLVETAVFQARPASIRCIRRL